MLRLLFVDGASVDEIATMYAVHRVTVWRWVQEARATMSMQIRAQLRAFALVGWAVDQVELSLEGALASTVTEQRVP